MTILTDETDREGIATDLDAIVREGARRMLLTALNAEVAEYVGAHADERDDEGKALVLRNGVAKERTVVTGAGALTFQAPRVDDRREGHRFTSAILPPWAGDRRGCPRCCRCSTCVECPPRTLSRRWPTSSAPRRD